MPPAAPDLEIGHLQQRVPGVLGKSPMKPPQKLEDRSGRRALDEGGVQLARLLVTAGTSLKELLDEGRFLLLQLGDALALVGHLLRGRKTLLRGGKRRRLLRCRCWDVNPGGG